MDEILTVQETATLLKVSRSTVWRWCNNKKIPAFKIGGSWRISRVALDKFMADGEWQNECMPNYHNIEPNLNQDTIGKD